MVKLLRTPRSVITNNPHNVAANQKGLSLVLADNDAGFLPNRLTTAQRNALTSPPEGLTIFNLTTHQYEYFNGTQWTVLGSGGASGSWVKIGSTFTVTNGANLSVIGFNHTLYDSHEITINQIKPVNAGGSNNQNSLRMQLSNDGGTSWLSSYFYRGYYDQYADQVDVPGPSASSIMIAYDPSGDPTQYPAHGKITLYDQTIDGNKFIDSHMWYPQNDVPSECSVTGWCDINTLAVTGVRLLYAFSNIAFANAVLHGRLR